MKTISEKETSGVDRIPAAATSVDAEPDSIKCVVWDLDNTLWQGVLLEDENVYLRQNVVEIIRTLDNRGILQAIASKNDYDKAIQKLEEFGIREFFLYPQINWNSKASSIELIAKSLNIGIDTFALIDDEPYEREEVNFSLPHVLCLDAASLDGLLELPRLNPRFVTEDSKNRRVMYLDDVKRKQVEAEFVGPQEEFLSTLEMVLSIAPAAEHDLMRAEELTRRTNQLNTTGRTYSYDELNYFRQSGQHRLWIAGLEDKFGSYGKIGLALIECQASYWTIKLLLMSCRVMSRGVGNVLISHVLRQAREAGVNLRADFVPNGRNRMLYVTYKFAGFREIERSGESSVLEHDLSVIQPFPDYLRIEIALPEKSGM